MRSTSFRGRDNGRIRLTCLRDNHRYVIIVADDGVGFPPGVTWPEQGKLGALIIQTLRENTKLEMNVVSRPGAGTKVELVFVYRSRAGKAN